MLMIDTKTLQRKLAQAGHSPGEIDGRDGPATRRAMRAAVESYLPGPDSVAGWSEDRIAVAWQQIVLKNSGIEVGEIDGFVGPQTEYAMEQWHSLLRSRPAPEPELREDDPPATDPSLRWPRQSDVRRFYGEPDTSQVFLDLPYRMRLAWDRDTWIDRIRLHSKVAESAGRALARVAAIYSPAEIEKHGFNVFSGSLNVRKMRGGTRPSMHSWGIAIDFDNQRNDLHWGRDRAYLARAECKDFLDAWEAEGWVSLGRELNYDWMHVQAARL